MTEEKFLRGMDRRAFVAGVAALGVMGILPACVKETSTGVSTPTSTSTTKNILDFAINNPSCIEPYNCQDAEGAQVCTMLFDSLTRYDYREKKLISSAAESWSSNEDASVFTFDLVPGAIFHNGDSVTAADFKFAWERLCDPNTNLTDPSVVSYLLSMVQGYSEFVAETAEEITGIKVLDEYTLQVTLIAPYVNFPFLTSHPALAPVPQAASDFKLFYCAPIGNGAFKMDGEWVDGQFIKVVRNDDYHGVVPLLDGVNFMIFEDEQTAYLEFEAGNLDFCAVPPEVLSEAISQYPSSADGYTLNPDEQLIQGEEFSVRYLCLNSEDELLKNVAIRKAISLAIDRQTICDTLYGEMCVPADGMIPLGINGYQEGSWTYARYDLEAAKASLVEAGYAGGEGLAPIKLSYDSKGSDADLIEMIRSNLTAAGFSVELDDGNWQLFIKKIQRGDYQMGGLSWIADYPTADNFLYPLFFTGAGSNYSGYSSATFDTGLMAARAIPDDTTRLAAVRILDAQVAQDVPVVPLFFYRHHHVGSVRVENLYYGPTGRAELGSCDLVE
ncbi:MAG: ABC transporter substrate-binding protein [Actinobacteria bacterium]|nr:ABC transporter substrate-binding protein [Actinomycetota bacterium]